MLDNYENCAIMWLRRELRPDKGYLLYRGSQQLTGRQVFHKKSKDRKSKETLFNLLSNKEVMFFPILKNSTVPF